MNPLVYRVVAHEPNNPRAFQRLARTEEEAFSLMEDYLMTKSVGDGTEGEVYKTEESIIRRVQKVEGKVVSLPLIPPRA